ncbi:MAG: hypothetical protein R3C44_17810 [Chloroflexota bacterium]
MSVEIQSIPESGRLEIDIKVTTDINVSALAARQKVNSFALSEISYLIHAGEPILTVGESVNWRVPLILSLPSRGDVGEVGAILVNTQTGQMTTSPQLIAEINARAEGLATHSPQDTGE